MFKKDLGQYCYASFRKLLFMYSKNTKASENPIGDITYKWLFYIACKHIDKVPEWTIETKIERKKLILLFCSKLSRDTAYLPKLQPMLAEVIASKDKLL